MQAAELLGQDVSGPDALAGADEGVEARLAWALGHFPFSLDPFQVKAVRHLLAGAPGRVGRARAAQWAGANGMYHRVKPRTGRAGCAHPAAGCPTALAAG